MPRKKMVRYGRLATLLAIGAVPLVSCTTLGTHVKGSFTCQAPAGSCAPTSVIDDGALAMLHGDPVTASPAGPYVPSGGSPDMVRASLDATPRRSGEKVVRIVFPAFIDRAGRYHEASAVHAVVERGGWIDADPARGPELAARGSGPSLGELAYASPEVPFQPAQVGSTQASAPAPSAVAVSASAAAFPTRTAVEVARASGRRGAVRGAVRTSSLVSTPPVRTAAVPSTSLSTSAVAAAASTAAPSSPMQAIREGVQARLATMGPVVARAGEHRPVAPSVLPVGSIVP